MDKFTHQLRHLLLIRDSYYSAKWIEMDRNLFRLYQIQILIF